MSGIAIIDYGLGNVGSVDNMFRRIGIRPRISADPDVLATASGLVLPGVGHFDEGMRNLRARGLVEPLGRLVREKRIPLIGICLGMQLLARRSEEGNEPGLGWLDADVKRFAFTNGRTLAVPHMGWNQLVDRAPDDPLVRGLDAPNTRFYFVHSYHVVCDRPNDVVASCDYGLRFTAAIHHENLYGTQFHPEKSHKYGMKILSNFADAVGDAR